MMNGHVSIYSFAAIAMGILGFPTFSQAIELSARGAVATLSGGIKDGDEFILRDFLASPAGASVRVIYLNSPGGRTNPAQIMAREIRAKRLVTVIDASRHRCNSACTGLFTAGVARHYINAGSIRDQEGGPDRGLGFHQGNSMQSSGQRGFSGGATAQMINTYYEMGVPGAANLV
ncbi:MAG: hypothetical protein ACRCWO_11195, partial [Bosea sp. (in: a-proteobacteria)]